MRSEKGAALWRATRKETEARSEREWSQSFPFEAERVTRRKGEWGEAKDLILRG